MKMRGGLRFSLDCATAFLLLAWGFVLLAQDRCCVDAATFGEIPVYNYTLEFVADEGFLDFQPNVFAGIAAAFHEYNRAPSIVDKPTFSVQLVNETDLCTKFFARSSQSAEYLDAGIVKMGRRFDYYLGNASAVAAYRVANPSNTMDDYLLSIGADPTNPQDMRARAAMAGVPLGLVGGSTVSSYFALNNTVTRNLTAFAMTAFTIDYLNNSRFVNLRQGIVADFPVIMNIGYHRADVRCTTFLMLHVDAPSDEFNAITASLFTSNGYPISRVRRSISGFFSFAQIAAGLARNPSCLLIIDIADVVEALMRSLQMLTSYDLGTKYIIGFGYDYKPEFSPPSDFRNLILTQIVPHPLDKSSKFARRANTALIGYFDAVGSELYGNESESNCSVVNASITTRLPEAVGGVCRIINFMKPSPFLEYQMMEGYAIGRLVIAAATSTAGVVNMKTIRDTVFRQRMFLFEDFDLGPYTDECSAGGFFPCFCTSGARRMFTSRVNGSTGRSYAIEDRPELGEKDIAMSTLSYSDCQVGQASPKRSINVLYLDLDAAAAAAEGTSSQFPGFDLFSTTLSKVVAQFSLNDFHASGSIYVVRRTLTLAEYQSASDVAQIISNLSARYQPFVVATSFSVNEQLANASAAVLRAGFVEMRGAGLRTAPVNHPLYPNEMNIDASLAELVHGAASTAASHGGSVMIVADNSANADLAIKSLHTFGAKESRVTVLSDGSEYGSVVAHVASGGVALVVSATTSTVQSVLSAVNGQGEATGGAVYIAAPEPLVYLAATHAASQTSVVTPSVNVFFASGMKAWWATTTPLGQRLAAVQYDDAMGGNVTQTFLSNPIHARAAYFAWMIFSAATKAIATAASLGGAPTFPDTLNSAATLDVAGSQVGPFSNAKCASQLQLASPDRTCQCQNGLSTVYVHSLTALLTGNTTAASTWLRMDGCGITYASLSTASSADSASLLITAVVAGVGGGMLLLLGGVVLVFVCFVGRNNGTAPKDESVPFTVVFTDIQSSTVLWARAPSAMAHAVDLHHEILRDVLAAHKGYEVKTIGDSFMIAFQSPRDALRFSVGAQCALFDGKWSPCLDETYREMLAETLNDCVLHTMTTSHDILRDTALPPLTSSAAIAHMDAGSPRVTIEIPGEDAFQNVPIAPRSEGDLRQGGNFEGMHRQLYGGDGSYERNWCGLRVRIGIHTGIGSIKKDPVSGGYDYYGTVVNTAARVEGVGHGGQILLTDSTYKEVSQFVTECGCSAVDLGEQPLRGLAAPVRLYQINLNRFDGRVYFPLRLDVEKSVLENANGSSSAESMGSGGSLPFQQQSPPHHRPGFAFEQLDDYFNPDSYAGHNIGLSGVVANPPRASANFILGDSYLVVSTLISTISASKGSDLLSALAKSWRVRLSKEQRILTMCKKRAVRNTSLKRGP